MKVKCNQNLISINRRNQCEHSSFFFAFQKYTEQTRVYAEKSDFFPFYFYLFVFEIFVFISLIFDFLQNFQVENECGEIPTVIVQNKIDLLDQAIVSP